MRCATTPTYTEQASRRELSCVVDSTIVSFPTSVESKSQCVCYFIICNNRIGKNKKNNYVKKKHRVFCLIQKITTNFIKNKNKY